MDRILIKPTAKEIVLRGRPEDGHVDVFSYNYEGNAANGLGGLFIVGQVQPVSEDTTYMINLVASLAKREYYSQPSSAPKDSFSRTLKKINEVLQDFFRSKDTKINIGIFTIAGENIFISRLGKFKIILARDNQNIDILNNINLFNKEHIQEKEFSNVISGKVMPEDKIFAFYPGRSIVAREKNIKSLLVSSEIDEFSEKLNSIKQTNDGFLCAGIHIKIDQYKEPAQIKIPQPKELVRPERIEKIEPRPVLTKAVKAHIDRMTARDIPASINPSGPIEPQENVPNVRPEPKPETKPNPSPTIGTVTPDSLQSSNVYYPGNKNVSPEGTPQSPVQEPEPLMRPTEFSSAKKDNFLEVILRKFKPSGVYIIGVGHGQGISKKKLIIASSTIIAVIAFLVVAKFTFIPALPVPGIENAQDKALSTIVDQVRFKLESAKTYKEQNNLFNARKLIFESLSVIASSAFSSSEKIKNIQSEVFALLDEIDKAAEFPPSLLQDISQTFEDDFQIWSFAWSLAKGTINVQKPEISGMVSYYPYQDNLYILTNDSLLKITDANRGKTNSVSWLNQDAKLPLASLLLAVDSKIFVLAENGILATFYKGDKVAEVNTSIPVNKNSLLLTKPDSPSLYLVDKDWNRIYVISRDSGTVTKTLKISGESFIIGGSMADDGTIYLVSKDNKVWKVVP